MSDARASRLLIVADDERGGEGVDKGDEETETGETAKAGWTSLNYAGVHVP